MKIAIRYFTKTNNTKKLADAIAKATGVEALSVDHPLTEDVDILFLGSSVYAAGVAREVKEFVSSINVSVVQVVNFSTAAMLESTYKQVKKLVEKKDIKMSDEEFHCRGSFSLAHKGRPNEDDIKNVTDFAKKVLNK